SLTAIENSDAVLEALNARADFGTEADKDYAVDEEGRRVFQGVLTRGGPSSVSQSFGYRPDYVLDGPWFNSPELTAEDLDGKVVLVDFWTYTCINCVRTLPYLRHLQDNYADDGLVILGVHSPEFEFEKNPENVRAAIEDLDVNWPVVLDNEFRQWRAYRNRFWPAKYLIDTQGNIRYYHFGEGHYEETEKAVQDLLREAGRTFVGGIAPVPNQRYADSPETYLGSGRADRYAG